MYLAITVSPLVGSIVSGFFGNVTYINWGVFTLWVQQVYIFVILTISVVIAVIFLLYMCVAVLWKVVKHLRAKHTIFTFMPLLSVIFISLPGEARKK